MSGPNIVVSFFDKTGNMVIPWRDAGYECWIVDIDHPLGTTQKNGMNLVRWDLATPWFPPFDRSEIRSFFAFPPCTDDAVSGAKWFKTKGLRALSKSISYVATSQEFAEWCNAPYMIEHPISTLSTHWRKPDHIFHPHEYTGFCLNDNYTKATCLWTGNGFVMPEPNKAYLGSPDDRIHKAAPGPGRQEFRSATPMGFACAVKEAS